MSCNVYEAYATLETNVPEKELNDTSHHNFINKVKKPTFNEYEYTC